MFPFDMQELSIDIAINCRSTGSFPVDFRVAPDAVFGASRNGFALYQCYGLDSRMTYLHRFTGDDPPSYPTITISARVYRKPEFVLVNVFLPIAVFVILTGLQFSVPVSDQDTRLSVSLTLVLTAAAYKFSIATMLPSVAYLTFVDKYIMFSFFIIFLMVVEGALVGQQARLHGEDKLYSTDIACLAVAVALFVLLHAWAAYNIYYTDRTKIDARKSIARINGPEKQGRMFFLESAKELISMADSSERTTYHGKHRRSSVIGWLPGWFGTASRAGQATPHGPQQVDKSRRRDLRVRPHALMPPPQQVGSAGGIDGRQATRRAP